MCASAPVSCLYNSRIFLFLIIMDNIVRILPFCMDKNSLYIEWWKGSVVILVFCLYLFTQLLYVFLQDVFTMLSGKPMIYQYISYGQLTFSGVNRWVRDISGFCSKVILLQHWKFFQSLLMQLWQPLVEMSFLNFVHLPVFVVCLFLTLSELCFCFLCFLWECLQFI